MAAKRKPDPSVVMADLQRHEKYHKYFSDVLEYLREYNRSAGAQRIAEYIIDKYDLDTKWINFKRYLAVALKYIDKNPQLVDVWEDFDTSRKKGGGDTEMKIAKNGTTAEGQGTITEDELIDQYGKEDILNAFIRKLGVDMDEWEVADWKVKDNYWTTSMKIADVVTDKDGKTFKVEKPMQLANKGFYVYVRFQPRFKIKGWNKYKIELMKDLKEMAPVVQNFPYNIMHDMEKEKFMLELGLYDVHLGRWYFDAAKQEYIFGTKVSEDNYKKAIEYHIQLHADKNITEILIPFGHDILTTDIHYPYPMTRKGTPQRLDHDWQYVYIRARKLYDWTIQRLSQIAPVYIPFIYGNHDPEKTFTLGDHFEAVYASNPNVFVNNLWEQRKYHKFGEVLIGMTHNDKSGGNLHQSMQKECKEWWSDTTFHEWHLGHQHREKQMTFISEDREALVYRYLRAMVPIEEWEHEQNYKRYVGSTSYLWSSEFGLRSVNYDTLPANFNKAVTEGRVRGGYV